MRSMSGSIKFALTILIGLGVLQAEDTSAQSQAPSSGRILLATVVDLAGKTQVDFGVDDFVIEEGGDEREVLDVHVADYPIVLLIDDDSESTNLAQISAAILRFVTRV